VHATCFTELELMAPANMPRAPQAQPPSCPQPPASLMPLVLSFETRHDLGFTLVCRPRAKICLGAASCADTISALNTLLPNLSVRSRIERQSCKRSIELGGRDASGHVGESLNELAGPLTSVRSVRKSIQESQA